MKNYLYHSLYYVLFSLFIYIYSIHYCVISTASIGNILHECKLISINRHHFLIQNVHNNIFPFKICVGPEKGLSVGSVNTSCIYLDEVYLVTALVPSETACLANSPGRRRRTAVWISREVMVDLLL